MVISLKFAGKKSRAPMILPIMKRLSGADHSRSVAERRAW